MSVTLEPVSPVMQQYVESIVLSNFQKALNDQDDGTDPDTGSAAQATQATPVPSDLPVATPFSEMSVPEKIAFQKQLYELVQNGGLNRDFLQSIYDAIGAQLKPDPGSPAANIVAANDSKREHEKSMAQIRAFSRNV